nr:hypothetical protein [Tanacetum cinerariifolium]
MNSKGQICHIRKDVREGTSHAIVSITIKGGAKGHESIFGVVAGEIPACCDDDDNYNSAIIPNEPVDSLSMGDEHLDTVPATESDEFIKSSVENLVPNPNGNIGTLNIKMMGDNSEQRVPIPGLMITRVLNQEKSPDLSSHQGHETFQPSAECPMIINGKNTPILDVSLFHFYPP